MCSETRAHAPKELGTSSENSERHEVTDIDDVESYLSQGWQYVAHLPEKKVIIKLNSANPVRQV
jgi:hypothetical protein